MKITKKEHQIKQISENYFVALKKIRIPKFSSGEVDKLSPFYIYFQDVEEAFNRLNPEYRRIINNEFFYQAYRDWWINDYTPAIFNKKRKMAIKEFVEVFYEIH